jgi:hypothetical protein
MTVEELTAIVEGIALGVRDIMRPATQRVDGLEQEIRTVRDALVTLKDQVRVSEARAVAAATKTQALEEHVKALRLELEADRAVRR